MHAWGLRLRRASRALALSRTAVLPSVHPDAVGTLDWDFGAHNFGIPSLHMPLSNASCATLPPPSHDSGSGWFATPFLYDSFIHYFTPVYPDDFQDESCPTEGHRTSYFPAQNSVSELPTAPLPSRLRMKSCDINNGY